MVGAVGIVFLLAGLLAVIKFLPGTSNTDPGIIGVVQANVDATNQGDIQAYMACVDPSSPAYASTRDQAETLLSNYKVHVELTESSVVDASATVAHVRVVMTTTEISGPPFRNNRITAVMELHKVNEAWKIYGQSVSNIEYLSVPDAATVSWGAA